MRTDNIKVTITIPIPYDKPDKNGNIYTEEAVEKAVNNLHKNLPIIFRDESEEKIIGVKVLNSQVVCDLRDGSRLLIDDFLKNYIESEKKSLQKKIMYYSQQISEVTKILHYIDN